MTMPQTFVRRHVLALAAVACLSVAGACGRAGTPKSLSPDAWASVDGREIRRDEVDKAYRREVQATPTPSSPDEVLSTKLAIVDALITESILLDRARTMKLDVTPAELDAAFTERKGSMSDEAFQQELQQRNLTADDMKEGLRRELLANKVVDQEILSKIFISDDDVRAYYEAHRAEFNLPEAQYHIAQIVVASGKEAQLSNRKHDDAITAVDALHKSDMLMERLKAGGDFGELAMDYSEDPQSAPRGGDLGFISASQLAQVAPALRDAVLKSQPGNINEVSGGGAHTLVLLVAREPAGQRDLTSPGVKETISTGLHDRKAALLHAAYITAAREDAVIVNNFARQLIQTQGKLPGLAPTAPGK